MYPPVDQDVERALVELNNMCDLFERQGWPIQAAEAEQLYVSIHHRLGRTVAPDRAKRLMRQLSTIATPRRRSEGIR